MKTKDAKPYNVRLGKESEFEFVDIEGFESGFVYITPDLATEWLEQRNTRNRKFRDRKTESFTLDMKNEQWDVNGESVIFSNTGILTDGQHRLKAIIDSGKSQYIMVVYGVDQESQDTIDTGTARHLGDQLHMKGYPNSLLLASTASLIVRVNEAYANESTYVGHVLPSHTDVIKFIEANKQVHKAAEVARMAKMKANLDCSPSGLGAVYFYLAEIDPYQAEEFIVHQVIDGLDWKEGSPAKALVERFASEKKITGTSFDAANTIAYTIMAWNAYRENREISRMQAPKGGLKKFPVAK
jgi:hypothetical protein